MDLMTDDDAMTFEELGAFLASDRVGPGCLDLSELDGLLAALAVGPGPVEPEEWAPLVWSGYEPDFRDADEARRVVYAIMDRLVTVRRQLRDDPGAYRPVFRVTDDGAEVAAGWAHGFFLAAGLRTEAWRPVLTAGEGGGGHAMALLMAQLPDEGGRPRVVAGLGGDDVAEARRRARELVPAALATVLRLRDEARRAGPRRSRRGPAPPPRGGALGRHHARAGGSFPAPRCAGGDGPAPPRPRCLSRGWRLVAPGSGKAGLGSGSGAARLSPARARARVPPRACTSRPSRPPAR